MLDSIKRYIYLHIRFLSHPGPVIHQKGFLMLFLDSPNRVFPRKENQGQNVSGVIGTKTRILRKNKYFHLDEI